MTSERLAICSRWTQSCPRREAPCTPEGTLSLKTSFWAYCLPGADGRQPGQTATTRSDRHKRAAGPVRELRDVCTSP
jgi:hypothetical protein